MRGGLCGNEEFEKAVAEIQHDTYHERRRAASRIVPALENRALSSSPPEMPADAVCVKAGRCRWRRQSSPRAGAAVIAAAMTVSACRNVS